MVKKTVAVLVTVYNRKDVTIKGLSSLYNAMRFVEDNYTFDIYMVDDGCIDGTSEAVREQFPDVHIVKGNGSLYWSGGMRKAWNVAYKTKDYNYYLWLNDDAELYENALCLMFEPIKMNGDNKIVSGAFCDDNGMVSYGGRDKNNVYLFPQKNFQKIYYMNGNLVLIPKYIFNQVGNISSCYRHSFGDWDYGIRSIRKGFDILLTSDYVGKTNRHDVSITSYLVEKKLKSRFKKLYSPLYAFNDMFYFNKMNRGILRAILCYCATLIYAVYPKIYKLTHKNQ